MEASGIKDYEDLGAICQVQDAGLYLHIVMVISAHNSRDFGEVQIALAESN